MQRRDRRSQDAVVSQMHSDWEGRARTNPLYAIDSSRRMWTIEDFYSRGPSLVQANVDPVLEQLDIDPRGLRVLEIGCGIGRLFAGLAERFGEVWGIDISPKMIEMGQELCPIEAKWLVGDGSALIGVDDDSVDHVLSYEVFQHIPDPEVIRSYLQEIHRVLRPGGTFQVQLREGSDTRRQAVVRALPRWLRVAIGPVLRVLDVLPVGGDIDTWLGCIVPPPTALEWGALIGLTDLQVLPDPVHPPGMGYWLIGRRASASPEGPAADGA